MQFSLRLSRMGYTRKHMLQSVPLPVALVESGMQYTANNHCSIAETCKEYDLSVHFNLSIAE